MSRRLLLAILGLGLTLLGCSSSGSAGPAAITSHAASISPAPRPPVLRRPLVAAARWEQEPEGYRLLVEPSDYGRRHARQAPRRAFDQALAEAGKTPTTLSASTRQSLFNQLRCHTVFARRKPTWNLETWRPDVGYLKTVLAECNP